MARAFDLILFDLDGTLIETAPEISFAVNDTLQHFALPGVALGQVERWIGHGTRELLIQALAFATGSDAQTWREAERLTTIQAEFDRYYLGRLGRHSAPYPAVREVLQTLRASGVKLAVLTNKEERHTSVLLAAHGLTALFDRVISGDTLARKKPDPIGILTCLAQFQVAASRALFVGDSSIDAATARNAGLPVWLLPYGYNLGQAIEACAPDRVIANFSALRVVLGD